MSEPRRQADWPDWLDRFPLPGRDQHKHDRGHVLVLAGRRHATGAARMAARAALRIGAGLVTIVASPSAADIVAGHVTAEMVRVCDGAAQWADVVDGLGHGCVVLGCGLAPDEGTREFVLAALRSSTPVLLDAGALTAFADERETLFDAIAVRSAATVLTPHGGEFARLFGRVSAHDASRRSAAVVVLKGPESVVASKDRGTTTIDHGPPWLATAGTGDVLAGMIGGLIAQGTDAELAARLGVWVHGEAARRLGPGMLATDLETALPGIIRAIAFRGGAF